MSRSVDLNQKGLNAATSSHQGCPEVLRGTAGRTEDRRCAPGHRQFLSIKDKVRGIKLEYCKIPYINVTQLIFEVLAP